MNVGPFAVEGRFELRRLSSVAEVRLGKMLQSAPVGPSDRAVPYLRAGSITSLDEFREPPEMYASASDVVLYGVRAGDLIVTEGGDVGRTAFVPHNLPEPTIIQNSLHRVRPREGDVRFLRYALDAVQASKWLEVLCNRSTFGHLTVDKLSAIRIPWPSWSQQRAIADYLDTETARIDTLIAKKSRQVELARLRLVVQAHRLTNGEPKVRLRRFVQYVRTGTTPSADAIEDLMQNDDFAWLAPGDLGDVLDVKPAARRLSSRAVRDGHCPSFPPDSTLIVGIGATAGRVAHLREAATGNQQVTCISVSKGLVPRFLSWQLWAREEEIRATAPYTTLPIVSNDFIRSLEIWCPAEEEQARVVNQLDSLATKTEDLCGVLRRHLRLLREHRQALVTAAVTGELEISGAT